MTASNTKSKGSDTKKKVVEKLAKENEISESYLVALFWNNPDFYTFHPKDKIDRKTFLNEELGFFFGLGRFMAENDIEVFDDISVANFAEQAKVTKLLEKYGDYPRMAELMWEVRGKEDNLDAYYKNVKKYRMLLNMYDLFGEKVLKSTEKYNYNEMQSNHIHTYWMDKVNSVGMDTDNKWEAISLIAGLREDVKKMSDNPAVGLPFYNSPWMTKICTGWDFGQVYILGGFGGSGKTSFSFNKVIMSCIAEQEKLLLIANEQTAEEFKKMLIITAIGEARDNEGNFLITPFDRQRLNEGEFTDDEFEKMYAAVDWVHALCQGDVDLVQIVFMEDYVIPEVKKIIRYHAARGYRSVMIDTGKPSDGNPNTKARWEIFTDDMKEIYKLARANGGGLNLRIWVNVQLSDAALRQRFLNEHAFGESKKIKNEASVVFMIRAMWADELDGEEKLRVFKYVKANPKNPKHKKAIASGKKYVSEEIKLKEEGVYYLVFTVKNRRGQDCKTGQKVLVIEPNFNVNTWREIGWTSVLDDKNY